MEDILQQDEQFSIDWDKFDEPNKNSSNVSKSGIS